MPAAGVGSINNTFGIKGVSEHTFFFKSITDAAKLRRQVGCRASAKKFQQHKQHSSLHFSFTNALHSCTQGSSITQCMLPCTVLLLPSFV